MSIALPLAQVPSDWTALIGDKTFTAIVASLLLWVMAKMLDSFVKAWMEQTNATITYHRDRAAKAEDFKDTEFSKMYGVTATVAEKTAEAIRHMTEAVAHLEESFVEMSALIKGMRAGDCPILRDRLPLRQTDDRDGGTPSALPQHRSS